MNIKDFLNDKEPSFEDIYKIMRDTVIESIADDIMHKNEKEELSKSIKNTFDDFFDRYPIGDKFREARDAFEIKIGVLCLLIQRKKISEDNNNYLTLINHICGAAQEFENAVRTKQSE